MCGAFRILLLAILLFSCQSAFAGSGFSIYGGPNVAYPSELAGLYVYDSAESSVTLEIRADGLAKLSEFIRGTNNTSLSAGGAILRARSHPSGMLLPGEFIFQGASWMDGTLLTRRYKATRDGSKMEIIDLTDPAHPIRLSPQQGRFFPWTVTFVLAAFVVGGLVGRYFATRPIKPKVVAQKDAPSR